MPQRLAGQLLDGGDPVADEPVFVVDTGATDESNWSIVATDRSAADGSWSVTVPNADAERYHAVAQFEESGTLKNALSKPFLTSQPFAQPGVVSVGFDVVSPTVSVGSVIPDSGLLHRYDSTELSLSDGQTVDPFPDESGSDNLSASGDPTFKTGVINGNPVTREDGIDDKHQSSFSSTLSQPFAIFAAVNIRSVSSSENEVYFWDTAQSFGPRVINNNGEWQIADSGGSSNGGSITAGSRIIGAVFDGSSTVLRVDGADETTHNTSDSLGGISLAHQTNAAYAPIDFGEVLFYDTSPNVSEVESYLSNKWGISL